MSKILHHVICISFFIIVIVALSGCRGLTSNRSPVASLAPSDSRLKIDPSYSPEHATCWGFIDKKGDIVIDPRFRTPGRFVDGLAAVGADVRDWKTYKTLVDKTGRRITPNSFATVSSSSEGMFIVTGPMQNNFKNPKDAEENTWLPEFRQTYFSPEKGVWNRFYVRCGSFYKGLAVVCSNESEQRPVAKLRDPAKAIQYFLINKKGIFLREINCRPLRYEMNFSEGLMPVRKDGKIGFIDTSGALVVPDLYDDAGDFHGGLVRVCLDGARPKWFFLNKAGQRVSSDTFESVHDFHEGLAAFGTMERDLGFIDESGKVVITGASCVKRYDDFSEGRARFVTKGLEEGFIDRTGSIVVPAKANVHFSDFHDGLCLTKVSNGTTSSFGYVDKFGKWIIPPMYKEADDFSEGLAAVNMATNLGHTRLSGNRIRS